jgi:hypothetical protein
VLYADGCSKGKQPLIWRVSVEKEMRSTNVESGAELQFLFLFMETAHELVQLHVPQIKSGTLKKFCMYIQVLLETPFF